MASRILASTAAIAAVFAFTSPATAAITIFNSAGNLQPSENVLIDAGLTGQTVFGHTNNSNTSVSFLSLTSGINLEGFANGQARVEGIGSSLDALRFFLTSNQGFGEVEYDLHQAASDTDTVNVTVYGSFGTETRTFDLGNGNNWFSAQTSGGDLITAVAFDTSGSGVDDIRQVRLGLVAGVTPPPAVPEPATWAMMLGGFGLLGATARRRSRTPATTA
jgi:hypothetical protein